ncbi:zinc ion binding / nucleic acid binding protein [Trifolium repens]|nr:zinc ion binding / nucleic acid binding protein [Trifolium repens]
MLEKGNVSDHNPLLGFVPIGRKLSTEEQDQVERSEKKIKRSSHEYTGESTVPVSYADLYAEKDDAHGEEGRISYKQSLLGKDDGDEEQRRISEEEEDENMDERDHEFAGLSIVEKTLGQYDCPVLVLSKREETRISRPWRQGVIVKLMGRRIGYKAVETRLKQMWVRKGVISIIDLGMEYFLVYFSNEEDYDKVLEEGPWMIYEYYLIVREWCPNFHPKSATIESAAVWVRIPDLPIEYYDAKVLNFIGNRIGRTVKVDKNTLFQERGKYARLCVEVDLTKPVLAMFELKNTIYKIEYEGLHMLCLACGKFGHYVDGCPAKQMHHVNQSSGENVQNQASEESSHTRGVKDNEGKESPWVVVQKPRRPRKTKDGGNNGGGVVGVGKQGARVNAGGSRFQVLEGVLDDTTNEGEATQLVPAEVLDVDPPRHDKGRINGRIEGAQKVTKSGAIIVERK